MEWFWDSSAVVPLVVEQQHSSGARDLYRVNPSLVVWQYTHTEVISALTKLVRQGEIDSKERDEAIARLEKLASRWNVVQTLHAEALDAERESAKQLMLRHPLTSADALQLAAALERFDPPHRRVFVVVDKTLATAATAEGFTVLRPAKRRQGGRGRR